LKKCIAAGMSRDAVRFGRVPKREKAKILAAMQSSKAKSIESKVVAEMSDERRLIDTVVRAHYDTCDYTADKIGPFIQKAQNKQKLTQCTGQTCPMKGGPQQSFLDEFSDQLMDHVRQVCTFAKFIPGFKCLGKDDQVTLLKSCVFEVLTVRLSGLFDNQSLVCLNGDVIRRETISAMPAGNAKFLMDSVFELAQRINRFRLSDAEIGLFCSVVIISADRPGLMSPGLVAKMQDKLKTVLENILAPRHPHPIFKDLTAILADLRILNTLHTEKFLQQAKVTREEVHAAAASPHSVLGGYGCTSDTWEEMNMADGDSTGSRSPKSSGSPATSHSFSLEDLRRSPMGGGGGGSVSSSESLGGNSETFSKLSVNDLKIHGSVLLNALTSPALSAAAHHRKRDISRLMGGGEPVTNTPRSQEEGPATGESKCPFKARKLDSPSDSGIDSPKAQGSQSTNTSVCSSPRSSMEEGAGGGEDGPDSMEDQHPLLKRALQQPPQPFNMGGGVTMFQDEVYKPHKKFRHNGRRDGDEPTSTQDGSCSPGPPTSILATQLAAPPTYRRASPPPTGPHQSLLATTLSRPVSVARAKRDEERSELLANLILDSGRWRPGYMSQSSLLMCAPLPAHSPLPGAAAPSAASLRGHLPVPVAPTQPTSTLVSPRTSVSATPSSSHKSTSQLRSALMDATTVAAQPLNLSVRTPPPADLAQPPEALKA